ncbi:MULTISPECIES: hypothetical protein [Paenarthrobacter]|uniref:hypothetical protein n=1 Tax=Paenarthrobacter TaxID=1742992 RepID=UPI001112FC45|nr:MULTISPECIES: hypothetical protein [Paenarthrobacter]WIV29268.1 hypothetical protein QN084_12910 [Paenarthrobacter sp. R1]WIV31652.1 hypothetical protein QN084_03270 [Paenarthrobacter sp. R1]
MLTVSLLLVFSFSLCAALCLLMKHPNAMGISSHQMVTAEVHELTASAATAVTAASDLPESQRACCSDQHGTQMMVAQTLRLLPEKVAAASTLIETGEYRPDYVPPGWFDPALERLDHLRPSLTVLSISRT